MDPSAHDKIAHRAYLLWRERGCPTHCDDAIWLEAERLLSKNTPPANDQQPNSFTKRVKAETAAESVVEYQITPASSEQAAIQAALQESIFTFRAEQ